MYCHFCYNAHVWAKEPHDEGLNDNNDGSSCSIGYSDSSYQMYFNSGMGVACNLELCRWHSENGWTPVAKYFPKFCPECGRKLDEYQIDERGTLYKRCE